MSESTICGLGVDRLDLERGRQGLGGDGLDQLGRVLLEELAVLGEGGVLVEVGVGVDLRALVEGPTDGVDLLLAWRRGSCRR